MVNGQKNKKKNISNRSTASAQLVFKCVFCRAPLFIFLDETRQVLILFQETVEQEVEFFLEVKVRVA